MLVTLKVKRVNGCKLEAYIYKLFNFLLSASCLGTFPYLRISLSWLYASPGFGVNSFAIVKLKKTYYTKLILEIFLESGVILTENNICQLLGLLIYFDASMSQHISR